MIATSAEYKTQIQAKNQRFSGSATIDYSDYNIDNSIESVESDPDRTSDGAQLSDGIETPTYKWWDWAAFEWGQHLRSENPTENEKGALSGRSSDINNGEFPVIPGLVSGFTAFSTLTVLSVFQLPPSFAIQFLPRAVQSVKVVFDNKVNQYAVDFDINIYVAGIIDSTINITGNTSVKYEQSITPILLVSKVEIIVYTWSNPGSKAKVIESFTSLQESYSGAELMSISVYEESDPVRATSPIGNVTANTCNLRLLNLDSHFDNDNQASPLAGNVIKNRRIKPFIQLNNIDTIPLGSFYATRWTVNNPRMYADVSGGDIISLMADSEYQKSQFITPGAPQSFSYSTTAEFALFTLTNAIAASDELQFGGAAVLCPDSLTPINSFGFVSMSLLTIPAGYTYCGEAIKTVVYTYTPGATVRAALTKNQTAPLGTIVKYFISYKTNEEYNEIIDNMFYFVPENISDTTQEFKIKVALFTNTTSTALSVQDFTLDLTEGISLYSLAAKVIQDFDDETNLIEGNYIIDQEYATYNIPNAYLKPQSYRKALKVITEAAAGRAYQRRDGFLILESLKSIETASRTFTDSNTYDRQLPVRPQSLYNRVIVKINTLTQGPSQVAATAEIAILDTEVQNVTVFFETDPSDTATYSGLPGGVTISNSTVYTWGANLEITNASGSDQDFTLTVNAKPYTVIGGKQVELDETESIRKNGTIVLPIDNPLIQTEAQADQVAAILIGSFGVQKRETMIDVTPDPAIELGDTIKSDGNFFLTNSSEMVLKSGSLIQKIGGKR